MIVESRHFVTTKDNQQIAVWKVYDVDKDKDPLVISAVNYQNILLIHGAFSDKRVCLGIARYLAKLGHDCYIMEWRGRGNSSIPKEAFNFETVACYDIAATLDYLLTDLFLRN